MIHFDSPEAEERNAVRRCEDAAGQLTRSRWAHRGVIGLAAINALLVLNNASFWLTRFGAMTAVDHWVKVGVVALGVGVTYFLVSRTIPQARRDRDARQDILSVELERLEVIQRRQPENLFGKDAR